MLADWPLVVSFGLFCILVYQTHHKILGQLHNGGILTFSAVHLVECDLSDLYITISSLLLRVLCEVTFPSLSLYAFFHKNVST